MVVDFDLDGDGKVTEDEINRKCNPDCDCC